MKLTWPKWNRKPNEVDKELVEHLRRLEECEELLNHRRPARASKDGTGGVPSARGLGASPGSR